MKNLNDLKQNFDVMNPVVNMTDSLGESSFKDEFEYHKVDSDALAQETYVKEEISELNRLLRGEISAVEACNKVINDNNFKKSNVKEILQQISLDHSGSVSILQKLVKQSGGEPQETSGAWGTFVGVTTATAQAFSESLAIGVLHRGEEHGRSEYQDVLAKLSSSKESLRHFLENGVATQKCHLAHLTKAKELLELDSH